MQPTGQPWFSDIHVGLILAECYKSLKGLLCGPTF